MRGTIGQEIGYTESFSPNGSYTAEWCTSDATVNFRITTNGSGWAAMGFSNDRLMPETDLIMVTGEGDIQDSWASGRFAPAADASQDATLVSASQANGTTVVEFSRAITTNDGDDLSIDQNRFMLWAMSSSSDSFRSRHSARGASPQMINFSSAAPCTVSDPFARLDDGSLTDPVERTNYIHDTLGTWVGDSTKDGEFNSSDLVAVFTAGKFETGASANWMEGDWDGDSTFGTGDLVFAFTDGGFEQGPRAAAAVPEPSSRAPVFLCLIGALAVMRRTH